MIKKGTVCIWQNCVDGKAKLNGTECTAMSNLSYIKAVHKDGQYRRTLGYVTDTVMLIKGYRVVMAAFPHQLREKNPPQDELDIITEKEVECT